MLLFKITTDVYMCVLGWYVHMRKMATESGRGHRIPERAGATVDCDLPDMGQELSSGLSCHLISLVPMLLFRKENNNNKKKTH